MLKEIHRATAYNVKSTVQFIDPSVFPCSSIAFFSFSVAFLVHKFIYYVHDAEGA